MSKGWWVLIAMLAIPVALVALDMTLWEVRRAWERWQLRRIRRAHRAAALAAHGRKYGGEER